MTMEPLSIYCELLHEATQKVYAADHEVHPDSLEYMMFQKIDTPAVLGYTFVRDHSVDVHDMVPQPEPDPNPEP